MAFEFQNDTQKYFDWQHQNAVKSIVPFINNSVALGNGCRVLEVGCNYGGVLKAFTKLGCYVVGVDIYPGQIDVARKYMSKEINAGKASFIASDIFKVNPKKEFTHGFDLIILKDVIEHISNKGKLLQHLHSFLRKDGKIFLGFPPWQMPFGGHQQMCRNFILSHLPFYHLLPKWIYRMIAQFGGENTEIVQRLMADKNTGISIEQFDKILKNTTFLTIKKKFYLINPIYEYKFGFQTRELWAPLSKIPIFRNFLTTSIYYLIEPFSVFYK